MFEVSSEELEQASNRQMGILENSRKSDSRNGVAAMASN
jgi:hypothetical protein